MVVNFSQENFFKKIKEYSLILQMFFFHWNFRWNGVVFETPRHVGAVGKRQLEMLRAFQHWVGVKLFTQMIALILSLWA